MSKVKNMVIAGDYKGHKVTKGMLGVFLEGGLNPIPLQLTKKNVKSYEVIDKSSQAKDAAHGALAGAFLFGGSMGALIGAAHLSNGSRTVAIEFQNGKKSLLEIDDSIYKALLKAIF